MANDTELIASVQESLEDANSSQQLVRVIAKVMINHGCYVQQIEKLDPNTIKQISSRYYAPDTKKHIADALILQGLAMLNWEPITIAELRRKEKNED